MRINASCSTGPGEAVPVSSAPDKTVRRHVLCSMGAPVTAIAQRVLLLSQCGLSEPPLEWLAAPLAADSESLALLAQQMEHACDRLADLEVAQRRRSHGFVVSDPDELQVWLLINLAGEPIEPAPPTAARSDPDVFQRCRAVMELTAWHRLRAHLAWHVVLLIEASDQAALIAWSDALRAAGEQTFAARFYLMSPVNAEHLRLVEAEWVEQVAQGITALLWVAPPAHTQLERAASSPQTLAAIGAFVWCSPAPLLHGWLAGAGAAQLLHSLCDNFQPAPVSPPTLLPGQEEERAILRRLAPALPGPAAHSLRPDWPALAALPARHAAKMNQWSTAAAEQSRQMRLAWLDEAQAAWSSRLASLADENLLAPAWPQPGAYLTGLSELRRHCDDRAQTVGDRLELSGRQLALANQAAAAARTRLETICAEFPPCSTAGALQALLQPWRWPRWTYDYWQKLPAALHDLTASHMAMIQRQGEEAAWHTLRQHYLAAAQQTQTQLNHLQQAQSNLVAACDLAADASREHAAALPEPWTEPRLASLQRRLLPEQPPAHVVSPLAAGLRLELDPAGLLAQLQERIASATADVATWSALDCLLAAFAGESAGQMEGAGPAQQWLDERLRAAAPLWPAQELAENGLAEEWWSAPEQGARKTWLTASSALVAAWRARHPLVAVARSALDAVQWLRWAEVNIDLEVPALFSFTEEDSSNDNSSLA